MGKNKNRRLQANKTADAPRPVQVAKKQIFAEERKVVKIEKLYHNKTEADDAWQPTFGAVFKMLLSVRIASALWGVINDCDEVYNYWEPLHMMLYREGFQTWEYSPEYSIRSYFYLVFHYLPASLFQALFGDTKIAVFTMVRLTIGLFCAGGEYYAYLAICKKINVATGRFFVIFTIFSPGMFIAGTAFLPSAFTMALGFYCLGAHLLQNWGGAIFCVAFGSMVAWPFVAILGLPIVFEMLVIRENVRKQFFVLSLFFGIVIGTVLILCDTMFYGKFVFAPYNIIYYNLIGGPGSTIYGVEPWTYYLKNIFLNWNVAFPLAIVSVPIAFLCFSEKSKIPANTPLVFGLPTDFAWVGKFTPVFNYYYAVVCWLIIIWSAPHKEERFLFPVYPHIAFLAAVGVDAVNRTILKKEEKESGEKGGLDNIYAVMFIFIILSLSRSYSTYNNYGAHLEIYKALNDELGSQHTLDRFHNPIRVCVGKEWHRYPSSFFIPETVSDSRDISRPVEMQFIRSAFTGILPKKWEKADTVEEMTRAIPTHMNDKNKEEESRYVPIESCDYIVDQDMPENDKEPDFRKRREEWKPVIQMPFIDPANSHFIFRAFHVPYFSNDKNTYTTYTLYRKVYDLP